jgi:hypothetical protein
MGMGFTPHPPSTLMVKQRPRFTPWLPSTACLLCKCPLVCPCGMLLVTLVKPWHNKQHSDQLRSGQLRWRGEPGGLWSRLSADVAHQCNILHTTYYIQIVATKDTAQRTLAPCHPASSS